MSREALDHLTVDVYLMQDTSFYPLQLSMNIKLANGTEVVFDLDPLARSIDPERSTYEVKSMKIEFKLVKQAAGVRWKAIEGDEEASSSTNTMMSAFLSYHKASARCHRIDRCLSVLPLSSAYRYSRS